MNTHSNGIVQFFIITGALLNLVAGHLVYIKTHLLPPLRSIATDLVLLSTGFSALKTQLVDARI